MVLCDKTFDIWRNGVDDVKNGIDDEEVDADDDDGTDDGDDDILGLWFLWNFYML